MADDPLAVIHPTTIVALDMVRDNPWVNPDTTPPTEMIVRSAQARGMKPEDLMVAQPQEHPSGVPDDPQ